MEDKKQKPIKEQYGWHEQQSFDDEPTGWLLEGGEEAYLKALEDWEKEEQSFWEPKDAAASNLDLEKCPECGKTWQESNVASFSFVHCNTCLKRDQEILGIADQSEEQEPTTLEENHNLILVHKTYDFIEQYAPELLEAYVEECETLGLKEYVEDYVKTKNLKPL